MLEPSQNPRIFSGEIDATVSLGVYELCRLCAIHAFAAEYFSDLESILVLPTTLHASSSLLLVLVYLILIRLS